MKRSALNVKMEQAGTNVEELKDSTAKPDVIAFEETQVAESGNTTGRKKEPDFTAADTGEAGTAPVVSDASVVALPMVRQDVVALQQVRKDEVAAPKEAGSQGMKGRGRDEQ